ncbi:bifunctional folylpolyglutamate synthase/dihydrofolate synthase [Streptococcus phocae subsp. phocae]
MNYQEMLAWIHDQKKFGIKPGLKRMLWVLSQLGNPQNQIKGIHVVGTNGKGSTVNNLQKIFTLSGYEVGTFTSPYIMDFRERISLDGHMISKEDLVATANRVRPIADRLPQETDLGPATEFELITLIMFLYFGEVHPVDIAIIEAGLGGLYDSTNVFQAMAVVCPSIGLDHQQILGDTYQDIARQKSGVLKGGEHVIMAIEQDEARQCFIDKAEQVGANIWEYKKQFGMTETGKIYEFTSSEGTISDLTIAMPGQHQVANAALAIMTSLLLKDTYPKVSQTAIKTALAKNHWLGRTELLAPNFMIDGAHNHESVAVLVDLLQTTYPTKKIHILFAAIDTKPISDMLAQLGTLGTVEVTTFDFPNAYPIDKYPKELPRVSHFSSFLERLEQASEDEFFLITGSLYFISEVRQYWKHQHTD